MEELLARLIFDNVKKSTYVDDTYIKKIIEIVIDEWNIKKYAGKYKINNDLKEKILANYNKIHNIININEQLLINPNNFFFYDIDTSIIFNKYLCILQILLHELIHVKQFEIETLDINNIDNLIVYCENKHRLDFIKCDSISDLMKYVLISRLAKKYYLYSPMERVAEIDSSIITKNVSKILNNTDIIDAMNHNINYNLIRGYEFKDDKLVPPTSYYLSKLKSSEYIDLIKKLGLSENDYNKLRLGLECNEEMFLSIGKKLEISYQKIKSKVKK